MAQNQEFLQDITVKPCLYVGPNAKPTLDCYNVKFKLQQTNLLILLNLDDHNNPVRPGQIFLDLHLPPKESESFDFEPWDETSWADLRLNLKDAFGLDAKSEEAVMDKLLHETTINDGYNNLESYYINDKGRRLQMVHLLVTISQLKVIHIPVHERFGAVPADYSKLHNIKRPRAEDELSMCNGDVADECSSQCSKIAKVEKLNVHGGGECTRAEKLEVHGGGGEECTICLDEMGDDNKQLASMCCDHVFREECIVKWLINNISCPLCRLGLSRESYEIN